MVLVYTGDADRFSSASLRLFDIALLSQAQTPTERASLEANGDRRIARRRLTTPLIFSARRTEAALAKSVAARSSASAVALPRRGSDARERGLAQTPSAGQTTTIGRAHASPSIKFTFAIE